MTILCVQTNNDDTMIIVSDNQLDTYKSMQVIALPKVMGLYVYNVFMDSIESIMVDKALEKDLNDALDAL